MFTSLRSRELKSLGKEGKLVHEHLSNRGKVVATFTMLLLIVTLFASLLPEASAAPFPVEIISINPESGPVGETVRVIGTIDNANGSYQILFDGKEAQNGDAAETTVDTTFTVPLSASGSHSVTLVDVAGGNQSLPANFNVTTSYDLQVEPARIQEGLNTTITLDVNNAEASTTLTFTINITDPESALYTVALNVSTNSTGSGFNSISYYGDFSAGANTNYVGIYKVTVGSGNGILATGNFTVGLTDKLEYGRTKTETVSVLIRGSGYKANETVNTNITFAGEPVAGWLTIAVLDGVVTSNWTIPSNASLGTYTVTLTNATGMQAKPVPDVQNFTVVEVIVHCQTQNRYDNEPLAGVLVGAFLDQSLVTSGVTNETGWVDLQVSHGNHTFRAFWRNVEVGSLDYKILENTTLPPLECELARLTITIRDETGFPLPFITVALVSNKTGVSQFETNSTGTIRTNSFTNISYTVEARRYDNLFNTTQIANLTSTRSINMTCPTLTLFVNATDSKGIPLRNAEVAVHEWSSGTADPATETTDDLGKAVFHLTFGKYKIWVYNEDHTIILNQTIVDLTEDQMLFAIHCKTSNVDLSVIVKDYFGQPISNALVEVKIENEETSQKTGAKGTASFDNITGGDSQISVSVKGKVSETRTIYLDEAKVVVFKLEKFAVVGGFLVEVTQLIAYVSLGIIVALIVLALIYRRLRLRKGPEEEKEKSL